MQPGSSLGWALICGNYCGVGIGPPTCSDSEASQRLHKSPGADTRSQFRPNHFSIAAYPACRILCTQTTQCSPTCSTTRPANQISRLPTNGSPGNGGSTRTLAYVSS